MALLPWVYTLSIVGVFQILPKTSFDTNFVRAVATRFNQFELPLVFNVDPTAGADKGNFNP
jgi:hypothetical protein